MTAEFSIQELRMAKISNQQFALKPQDLYVLLAMLVGRASSTTYPDLSARTGLADRKSVV